MGADCPLERPKTEGQQGQARAYRPYRDQESSLSPELGAGDGLVEGQDVIWVIGRTRMSPAL